MKGTHGNVLVWTRRCSIPIACTLSSTRSQRVAMGSLAIKRSLILFSRGQQRTLEKKCVRRHENDHPVCSAVSMAERPGHLSKHPCWPVRTSEHDYMIVIHYRSSQEVWCHG